MLNLSDQEKLTNLIVERYCVSGNNGQKIGLLLIGGFSRSGKTHLSRYLSNAFSEKGILNIMLSLDSWIVSLEKRKPGWTVMERYERESITKSVVELLAGREIFPPVYHAPSRKRVSERSSVPIAIKKGIVIAEGVVALSLEGLREQALLKIFVDLPESERVSRMKRFYIEAKLVHEDEAERILREREREEVPLIKKTCDFADIVFTHPVL